MAKVRGILHIFRNNDSGHFLVEACGVDRTTELFVVASDLLDVSLEKMKNEGLSILRAIPMDLTVEGHERFGIEKLSKKDLREFYEDHDFIACNIFENQSLSLVPMSYEKGGHIGRKEFAIQADTDQAGFWKKLVLALKQMDEHKR